MIKAQLTPDDISFLLDQFKAFLGALVDYDVTHVPKYKKVKKSRIYGITDHKSKRITLYKNWNYLEGIDTLVHELTHAAYPDVPEAEVSAHADTVCELLWAK